MENNSYVNSIRTISWIGFLMERTKTDSAASLWQALSAETISDVGTVKAWMKGTRPQNPTITKIDEEIPGSKKWFDYGPFGLPLWEALASNSAESIGKVKSDLTTSVKYFDNITKKPREFNDWVDFINLVLDYNESKLGFKIYEDTDKIKNQLIQQLTSSLVTASMDIFKIDRQKVTSVIFDD